MCSCEPQYASRSTAVVGASKHDPSLLVSFKFLVLPAPQAAPARQPWRLPGSAPAAALPPQASSLQEARVALEGAAQQAASFCSWWASYAFLSAEQLQQLSHVLHWRGPDRGGRLWLVISNKLAVQLACQRGQEYVARLLVSAVRGAACCAAGTTAGQSCTLILSAPLLLRQARHAISILWHPRLMPGGGYCASSTWWPAAPPCPSDTALPL